MAYRLWTTSTVLSVLPSSTTIRCHALPRIAVSDAAASWIAIEIRPAAVKADICSQRNRLGHPVNDGRCRMMSSHPLKPRCPSTLPVLTEEQSVPVINVPIRWTAINVLRRGRRDSVSIQVQWLVKRVRHAVMDTVIEERITNPAVHCKTQIPIAVRCDIRRTGEYAQVRVGDLSIVRRGQCFF